MNRGRRRPFRADRGRRMPFRADRGRRMPFWADPGFENQTGISKPLSAAICVPVNELS